MAGLERHKRRRGKDDFNISRNRMEGAMDLFVPIPTSDHTTNPTIRQPSDDTTTTTMKSQTKSLLEPLLFRLQETGYSVIALTHIVNGCPRDPEDRVHNTIPNMNFITGSKVKLLRRLHIIVENLSDMKLFDPQSVVQQQLLSEYDLISIAPRSDVIFQEACTCDYIDIVTLDGTTSISNSLPYTIRSTDIRAIRNRNAILEISYAVPILNRNARKGLVQTCRSLITASLGGETTTSRIPILFSSGYRSTTGSSSNNTTRSSTSTRQSDVGSVAFRTPDDLINVLQSILSLDTKTSVRALTESGQVAIQHGITRQQRRRHQELHHRGEASQQQHSSITVIGIEIEERQSKRLVSEISKPKGKSKDPTSDDAVSKVEKPPTRVNCRSRGDDVEEEEEASDEDGFLAL